MRRFHVVGTLCGMPIDQTVIAPNAQGAIEKLADTLYPHKPQNHHPPALKKYADWWVDNVNLKASEVSTGQTCSTCEGEDDE